MQQVINTCQHWISNYLFIFMTASSGCFLTVCLTVCWLLSHLANFWSFQHEESKFCSQGTSHSSSYGILEAPPEHYTKLLQSKYRKQYSFYFGLQALKLKLVDKKFQSFWLTVRFRSYWPWPRDETWNNLGPGRTRSRIFWKLRNIKYLPEKSTEYGIFHMTNRK